jgi:hypothetical protein
MASAAAAIPMARRGTMAGAPFSAHAIVSRLID